MSDLEQKRTELASRPKPEAWKPSDASTAHQRRYQAALKAAAWRPVQVRDRESGDTFAAEFVHVPSEAYGASGVGSDVLRIGSRVVADAAPRNFAARFEILGDVGGAAPTPRAPSAAAVAQAPSAGSKREFSAEEVRATAMKYNISELSALEALEGAAE